MPAASSGSYALDALPAPRPSLTDCLCARRQGIAASSGSSRMSFDQVFRRGQLLVAIDRRELSAASEPVRGRAEHGYGP